MMHATKMAAISIKCKEGLVRFSFGVVVCMPIPLVIGSLCRPCGGWRRRGGASGDVSKLRRFIDQLDGDGRSGFSALAAVFDNHGVDDLRVIRRREADEPRIG